MALENRPAGLFRFFYTLYPAHMSHNLGVRAWGFLDFVHWGVKDPPPKNNSSTPSQGRKWSQSLDYSVFLSSGPTVYVNMLIITSKWKQFLSDFMSLKNTTYHTKHFWFCLYCVSKLYLRMRKQVAEHQSLNTLHLDYGRVQHPVDPDKDYPES